MKIQIQVLWYDTDCEIITKKIKNHFTNDKMMLIFNLI